MPKPNNAPQVNIQRPCYAMASTDGQTADITMYGDIVEKQPIDRWTNEPIPGQYIVESEFLNDLAQIEGCSQITIRMDSLGGDAGVSILIHNRLRELAAKGTKLVCIVDGVAMSAFLASLNEWRQPYHVRLRYRPRKSVQPRDDSQMLEFCSWRIQRR